MHRSLVVLSFLLVSCTVAEPLLAQNAPAPTTTTGKPNHNTYGSPLDTIMSSHLWTDVGQPKDFVTESRPDPKTLNYTPLTGKDPDRPKPRDKANVEALQAELERDLVRNTARGDHPKAAAKASSKGSAKGSAKTGTNVRHAAAQPAN